MNSREILYSRYIPLHLWYPHRAKAKRGPGARPLCRRCQQPVPKRRRVWCSDECELEALVVCGYQHAIKARLLERDKGVCQACGLQCELLRDIRRFWYVDEYKGHMPKMLHANLAAAGFDTGKSLWDAHHIIPVEQGGARMGSKNLITLCQLCHKRAHNPERPDTAIFLKSKFHILANYFEPDFSSRFNFPT
jgi:hypothetical protein